MRASAAPRPTNSSRHSQASAHLGGTYRSILVSPDIGFERAFAAVDKRATSGSRPVEGIAPSLFACVGGAASMALWLKVGALLGLRHASTSASGWGELAASLGVGAVIGVLALGLWGVTGALWIRALGGDAPRRRLRVAAGAAAFPQLFAVAILLPLDLLIVGPASFTADKLSDPLATAWAAISVAVALSCLVWSVYLFVKGLAISSGLSRSRALLASCGALVTLLIAGGALLGVMAIVAGATT